MGEQVTSETANRIVTQLLFLEAEDQKDIYLSIHLVDLSLVARYLDTMQHAKPDIHTVCVGLASMGAFLLAAGLKVKK